VGEEQLKITFEGFVGLPHAQTGLQAHGVDDSIRKSENADCVVVAIGEVCGVGPLRSEEFGCGFDNFIEPSCRIWRTEHTCKGVSWFAPTPERRR